MGPQHLQPFQLEKLKHKCKNDKGSLAALLWFQSQSSLSWTSTQIFSGINTGSQSSSAESELGTTLPSAE